MRAVRPRHHHAAQGPIVFLDTRSFDFQRFLTRWSNVENAGPKRAAVERRPEAVARKRRCREVAARVN